MNYACMLHHSLYQGLAPRTVAVATLPVKQWSSTPPAWGAGACLVAPQAPCPCCVVVCFFCLFFWVGELFHKYTNAMKQSQEPAVVCRADCHQADSTPGLSSFAHTPAASIEPECVVSAAMHAMCDHMLTYLLSVGPVPLLCLCPLHTKLPLPVWRRPILPQSSGAWQRDCPESDRDHNCSSAHCHTHCDGLLKWSVCRQAQSEGHTCAGSG